MRNAGKVMQLRMEDLPERNVLEDMDILSTFSVHLGRRIEIFISSMEKLLGVAILISQNRGVQSRRGSYGNPSQNPITYTWHMMIFLSIKVSFLIPGVYHVG